MEGYMTLEEAIHAYYTNGVVNLPESDVGDFEFEQAPTAHDIEQHENLTPTSVDRCDLAAEISSRDYGAAFPNNAAQDPSSGSNVNAPVQATEPTPPTS